MINFQEMSLFSTVNSAEHSSKHAIYQCTSLILDKTFYFIKWKLIWLAWSCSRKVAHSEIWTIVLSQISWFQHNFENVSCWVSERTICIKRIKQTVSHMMKFI